MSQKLTTRFDFFFFLVVSLLLSASILNVYVYTKRPRPVVYVDTSESELRYWEQFVRNNPSFRDGYLIIADIKKNRGDVDSSKSLIGEAVKIDPYILGVMTETEN